MICATGQMQPDHSIPEAFTSFTSEADRALPAKTKELDRVAAIREELSCTPNLKQLFFEVTQKCNERCFHCGSGCDANAPSGLPVEKYAEILNDVAENFETRSLHLNITGGEPLLRNDFFDIVREVHKHGFRWGMTTNGTLITRKVSEKLADYGMRTVSVSIDGLEDTHDAQRHHPGGWQDAIDGIRALIDTRAFENVQVTTIVNHRNIVELDELFELFITMDIDSWRVAGLEPIGRALDHPDMLLTDDDQRRIMTFILEKRRQGYPVEYGCCHFLGVDLEGNVRPWMFLCQSGIRIGSIDALGNIRGCLDVEPKPENIYGNVAIDRFSDVWQTRFGIMRTSLSERNSACRECEYKQWCDGGSRHSWDYDADKPRICFKEVLFPSRT